MRYLFLMLMAVLMAATDVAAESWNGIARSVKDDTAAIRADAEQAREIMAGQRAEIKKEFSALKTSIAVRQKKFDGLEKEYKALLAREKQLEQELEAQAHEIKTIDGTIRSAGKQARDYFHECLTAPEFPQRAAVLDDLLQEGRFSGLGGIKQLLELYAQEIKSSGDVLVRKGEFTATDGSSKEGEILRLGSFTSAYRTADGSIGFLRPVAGGTGLVAVQGDPGWRLSGVMDSYFNGEGGEFPVDISNGAALQRLAQEQKSISDWLAAGGILVWPIIIVGVVALFLILERFYSLGRIRANSDRNMQSILDMVAQGQWHECRQFCLGKPNFPTCRIINHTLKYVGSSREVIENAFQGALLKELPMLERFLPTLGVLAAVAPLLGLLGTVTGMINTFQIITVYGTGDPRMMSGGISEALVTTQLGLAVAVPIMLLHHILDRRVDKIVGDMEEKGTAFSVALLKNGDSPVKMGDLRDAA